MQKPEKAKNTVEIVQSELMLGLPEVPRKRFKTKYTALISILKRTLTEKEYRAEIAIISKIKKLGFTEKQIYGAWLHYEYKGRKYNSFAILLWEESKLIKDILNILNKKEAVEARLDEKDHRAPMKIPEQKAKQTDWLL